MLKHFDVAVRANKLTTPDRVQSAGVSHAHVAQLPALARQWQDISFTSHEPRFGLVRRCCLHRRAISLARSDGRGWRPVNEAEIFYGEQS